MNDFTGLGGLILLFKGRNLDVQRAFGAEAAIVSARQDCVYLDMVVKLYMELVGGGEDILGWVSEVTERSGWTFSGAVLAEQWQDVVVHYLHPIRNELLVILYPNLSNKGV